LAEMAPAEVPAVDAVADDAAAEGATQA